MGFTRKEFGWGGRIGYSVFEKKIQIESKAFPGDLLS